MRSSKLGERKRENRNQNSSSLGPLFAFAVRQNEKQKKKENVSFLENILYFLFFYSIKFFEEVF